MNQQVKTKRDFPYVTLILIVTLVLVVAILGYTFVESVGIIGRLDNAAKSNTMKLNEKELDVYRFHVAQNQLYTEFLYTPVNRTTRKTQNRRCRRPQYFPLQTGTAKIRLCR